jgi:hypothetical protein
LSIFTSALADGESATTCGVIVINTSATNTGITKPAIHAFFVIVFSILFLPDQISVQLAAEPPTDCDSR